MVDHDKSEKIKWLSRELITGPYLALCTDKEQFKEILDGMELVNKMPIDDWILNGKDATAHTFDNTKSSTMCCVVCVRITDKPIEAIAGLLCHEAVHVFQSFVESIGDKYPSKEFEAYSIQHIFQALFEDYVRQKKEKE